MQANIPAFFTLCSSWNEQCCGNSVICAQVTYLGEKQQLTAMLLTKIKATAKTSLQNKLTDCVLLNLPMLQNRVESPALKVQSTDGFIFYR